MNIKHRLYCILAAVFLVVMGGSTGYYLILGSEPKFLDCVYMTVISLTTVGYEEVVEVTGNMWAQIFTMFLITFGMGIILYGIISRMTHPKLEPKLRKAGADAVVSPNIIGALRIVSEMIRPTVVDFLDSMLRSSQGNLRINQITVSKNSATVGKTINQCGLKDQFGLLVLGARFPDQTIRFNPDASERLHAGMTQIVMGEVDNVMRAQKAF